METEPSRKIVLFLGIFYLIAHGGILLIPNTVYWDGWVLARSSPEVIFDKFSQAGSMFNFHGYLHVAMLKFGPWLYRVLTFCLMFIAGLLLDGVIKHHVKILPESRFFIVLLFLVLPFNIARISLIVFPYTTCYLLFFLAWRLMDRFRLLALFLFFLSFNTNSLLVFYAVPIFENYYRKCGLKNMRLVVRYIDENIYFILLPFVYYALKVYFFSPSGLYQGYNENYTLLNLIPTVKAQVYDASRIEINVFLCFLFTISSLFLIKNTSFFSDNKVRGLGSKLLVLGLFVFLLSVFPYWILGHEPTFYGWKSRHQLLMPLGSALIIVGFLSNINKRFRIILMSFVVGTSLALNVSNYFSLFVDSQKQQKLIQQFSQNEDLRQAGLVIVDDRTVDLNAIKRRYRFYEWNGMLAEAFGDEKRFAITQSKLEEYVAGGFDIYFSNHYNAGLFRRDSGLPSMVVRIDREYLAEGFKGKIVNFLSPQITISVSEIDL